MMTSTWSAAAVVACLGMCVLAMPPTTDLPQLMTVRAGCQYNGNWYAEGEGTDDPCQPCRCYSGQMACAVVDCFIQPPCVDAVRVKGQCCPSCPNGKNCRAPDGTIIPANGTVYHPDPDTSCSCEAHGHFWGPAKAVCAHRLTTLHPHKG